VLLLLLLPSRELTSTELGRRRASCVRPALQQHQETHRHVSPQQSRQQLHQHRGGTHRNVVEPHAPLGSSCRGQALATMRSTTAATICLQLATSAGGASHMQKQYDSRIHMQRLSRPAA
jgi:hypothetical protein